MARISEEKFFVDIEEPVLKWAVESCGLTYNTASKKISEKETLIEDWVSKKSKPTFRQLEKLANLVKRPIGAFFLSSPPDEKPTPPDFRMISGKEGMFERKTILAIRKARALQKIVKELEKNLDEETKVPIKKFTLKNKPSVVASEYRKFFGIDEKIQLKFKSPYELYHSLRFSLEKMNIFCFQISMPMEDARGFALSDEEPYIVVANSADLIEARIFTLMHEFGHILLGETGIDIPDLSSTDKTEKWCNDFASSFLLPEDIANRVFKEKEASLSDTDTLNLLSKRYKVSKAMLLYNMLSLHFIERDKFDEIIARYKPKLEENVKIEKVGKKKSGSPSIENKRISEMGNKFVNLVANNLDKSTITFSDALNYLSIKSRRLDKLLGKAKI